MKISDSFKPTDSKKPDNDQPKGIGDILQKALEQQHLSDQKNLEKLSETADATDAKKDTQVNGGKGSKDISFGQGSPCGRNAGCSGSHWCGHY